MGGKVGKGRKALAVFGHIARTADMPVPVPPIVQHLRILRVVFWLAHRTLTGPLVLEILRILHRYESPTLLTFPSPG